MATLYEQDVVLWAEQQGKLLRAAAARGRNEPIDWENLAEEIESLGRSQTTEAKGRLFRILEHLLKLEFSPQTDPHRGWSETVGQQRAELAFLLEDSPSLVPRLPDLLDRVRERAVLQAAAALDEWGETDAARAVRQHQGRYTVAQVLGESAPGER